MPAEQRGQPYKLGPGRWGLRYYDENGKRRRRSTFPSRSAALAWFRDIERPRQLGIDTTRRDLTFAELVDVFLERHAAIRSPRTIRTLRERLRRPVAAFGTTPLRDLERLSGELADFAAGLPQGYRYSVMSAVRQALNAGVRWGYLTANPAAAAGPNPQPPPRPVRVFTLDELDKIAAELPPQYAAIPAFAAATGLRPAEWARLERRDIDRESRTLTVRGTKTERSRREVPLSRRALEAIDRAPARLDTRLVFPAPGGGVLNLDNWRRRVWAPPSTRPGSKSRRGSTTCEARSRATHSMPASRRSNSPGSWVRPSR